MESYYQGMFSISWLQLFRYQDIDANGVFIDDFVAAVMDVERGKLFWIHG